MANEIITDLVTPVSYVAGEELVFRLTLTAPEAGTYYVLGALYDSDLNYISGTLFGVLQPEGAAYASNSSVQMNLWELLEDEIEEINCKFVLDRTSVTIGLFLMEMTGDEPSLDDDTEIGSTTVVLVDVEEVELDISSLVSMLVSMVVIVGMMGVMMKVAK